MDSPGADAAIVTTGKWTTLLTPQEKKAVYLIAIGVTISVLASMLLCACGAGVGFLIGVAKEIAKGSGG